MNCEPRLWRASCRGGSQTLPRVAGFSRSSSHCRGLFTPTLSTDLPVLLDTDFLSSFAWVDRMDIIESRYSGRMVVPEEVMTELDRVPHLASCVRQSTLLIVIGAVGLAAAASIHAVTGLSQTTVDSGGYPTRAAGWEQMRGTLRVRPGLFLKRFLVSWVVSPLTSIKAAVTILVLAPVHWPAWAFARRQGKTIDLADKSERDRYYAVVSVLTVLVGTVLAGLAATLWR